MIEITPRLEETRRWRAWKEALGRLMSELRLLEAAKAPGQKYLIREDIKETCREIDRMQPPPRWRSWDELGRSVETGRPAQRRPL